jgi:hypothetical protein
METKSIAKWALTLSIMIITIWFISDARMKIVPLKDTTSVYQNELYDCPGVGLQDKDRTTEGACTSNCYVGCKYDSTQQLIKHNFEGKGVILYWD